MILLIALFGIFYLLNAFGGGCGVDIRKKVCIDSEWWDEDRLVLAWEDQGHDKIYTASRIGNRDQNVNQSKK